LGLAEKTLHVLANMGSSAWKPETSIALMAFGLVYIFWWVAALLTAEQGNLF